MRLRRAAGLAELVVTVALAGVVMAAASRSLTQHLRWQRERTATAAADEIVREAHEVLRAEIGRAAGDVRVLGDTAVDVPSLRGLARVCDAVAGRLIVPTSPAWWSAPRGGDSLAVLDTLTRTEWRTVITAVGTQRASSACPAGGTRLTLAAPAPSTVPVRVIPVRVWRMMRYAAYRAADGTWWLGERTCTPACGLVQPVAGPLRPPAQGGLRLSVVLDGSGRPRGVDLFVRAEVAGRHASLAARIPVNSVP